MFFSSHFVSYTGFPVHHNPLTLSHFFMPTLFRFNTNEETAAVLPKEGEWQCGIGARKDKAMGKFEMQARTFIFC